MIEIGGIEDHVLILADLSPTLAISNSIRDIKANSAKRLNELQLLPSKFEWQKGYGAFSVSESQIATVVNYIRNQKEHHRTKTFEQEYVEFLQRHGINFERRFLFEGENA